MFRRQRGVITKGVRDFKPISRMSVLFSVLMIFVAITGAYFLFVPTANMLRLFVGIGLVGASVFFALFMIWKTFD